LEVVSEARSRREDVKRRVLIIVLVAGLAGVIATVPAMAAKPLGVHIEDLVDLSTNQGQFSASGLAVDSELLSVTGYTSTGPVTVSPSPKGDGFAILSMVKYFACERGTFDVELVVTVDWSASVTYGNWHILGGTGDYANLQGSGKLFGTGNSSTNTILDVYDGSLKDKPLLDVEITVPTPLPAGDPIPFSASGPAVGRGLLCGTGTVSTGPITTSPSPLGDRYATLSMVKYFACGGGTFDVSLIVTLDNWTGSTSGQWRISRGTGSYANLKGNGTITGTFYQSSYSVLDVYSGRLKN
jgi:hypothetical protein